MYINIGIGLGSVVAGLVVGSLITYLIARRKIHHLRDQNSALRSLNNILVELSRINFPYNKEEYRHLVPASGNFGAINPLARVSYVLDFVGSSEVLRVSYIPSDKMFEIWCQNEATQRYVQDRFNSIPGLMNLPVRFTHRPRLQQTGD